MESDVKEVVKILHNGKRFRVTNPYINKYRPNAYTNIKNVLSFAGFRRLEDRVEKRTLEYVLKGFVHSTYVDDNNIIPSEPSEKLLTKAPFLEGLDIFCFYDSREGHNYFRCAIRKASTLSKETKEQAVPFFEKIQGIHVTSLRMRYTDSETHSTVEREIHGGVRPVLKEIPAQPRIQHPVIEEQKLPEQPIQSKPPVPYTPQQRLFSHMIKPEKPDYERPATNLPRLNLRPSKMHKEIIKKGGEDMKLYQEAYEKIRSSGEEERLTIPYYLWIVEGKPEFKKKALEIAEQISNR